MKKVYSKAQCSTKTRVSSDLVVKMKIDPRGSSKGGNRKPFIRRSARKAVLTLPLASVKSDWTKQKFHASQASRVRLP